MKTTPDKLTAKILAYFSNLKGFDWWYDDLDPFIQNEIFENLQKLLKKELKDE